MYAHDRHHAEINQSWEDLQLQDASRVCKGHAAFPSCSWSQPLHKIILALSPADAWPQGQCNVQRHRRSTRRPFSHHQVQLQGRLSVFPMFLPSSWTRVHCRLWRMQRQGVSEYSQQNAVPWRRQLLRWGIVNCLSQRSKRSLTFFFGGGGGKSYRL